MKKALLWLAVFFYLLLPLMTSATECDTLLIARALVLNGLQHGLLSGEDLLRHQDSPYLTNPLADRTRTAKQEILKSALQKSLAGLPAERWSEWQISLAEIVRSREQSENQVAEARDKTAVIFKINLVTGEQENAPFINVLRRRDGTSVLITRLAGQITFTIDRKTYTFNRPKWNFSADNLYFEMADGRIGVVMFPLRSISFGVLDLVGAGKYTKQLVLRESYNSTGIKRAHGYDSSGRFYFVRHSYVHSKSGFIRHFHRDLVYPETGEEVAIDSSEGDERVDWAFVGGLDLQPQITLDANGRNTSGRFITETADGQAVVGIIFQSADDEFEHMFYKIKDGEVVDRFAHTPIQSQINDVEIHRFSDGRYFGAFNYYENAEPTISVLELFKNHGFHRVVQLSNDVRYKQLKTLWVESPQGRLFLVVYTQNHIVVYEPLVSELPLNTFPLPQITIESLHPVYYGNGEIDLVAVDWNSKFSKISFLRRLTNEIER